MVQKRLMEGLAKIDVITLYGPPVAAMRTGIVSFNIKARHCSALGHKSMGTLNTGMVSLSLSHFTTDSEIDRAVEAVKNLSLTSN